MYVIVERRKKASVRLRLIKRDADTLNLQHGETYEIPVLKLVKKPEEAPKQ